MSMAAIAQSSTGAQQWDWLEMARTLGKKFAARAAQYDAGDRFVSENYQDLRERKFFSAGIPRELGGGGSDYSTLCRIVQEFGRHCGSTGLAFAMHTHPLALNVFKYLRGDEKAEKTLRKLAANELIIAGTGANDWLDSSGEAVPVAGGYRVTARKRFVSGGPGAQVFVTSAPCAGENGRGVEILHFAIPFGSEGVSIIDTWRTIGMRGTGSNDVSLENVFVPEEAIVARRPAGVWHPLWDAVLPVALPLISACYVGLAEAAAAKAGDAARAQGKSHLAPLLGEMLNELTCARLALNDMISINNNYQYTPGIGISDSILVRKTLAARAVKATVEKAAEIVGGAGFFRGHEIERILRDVRAMHFHPLPEKRQQLFSGRIALGLDPIKDQDL